MPSKLIFSQDEHDRRIQRVKEAMDRQGMETLLVVDPANMNYLTGYDGWSFYVHQGVILSLDSDTPLWFGRQQDANGARLTTWLPDDRIFGYPDEYVQSRVTHTMRYVAQLMRDQGLAEKRLGLEMDGYWFSARMYLTLEEELPQSVLPFVDGETNPRINGEEGAYGAIGSGGEFGFQRRRSIRFATS
jgi:Xaa-Pro aminopeptidase